MKNIKFLLLIPIVALASCGNDDLTDDKIPAEVKSAFEASYQNATDVEWEQDAEGYEVEFKMDGTEFEVTYAPDGAVVKIEDENNNAIIDKTMPDPEDVPKGEIAPEDIPQEEGDGYMKK